MSFSRLTPSRCAESAHGVGKSPIRTAILRPDTIDSDLFRSPSGPIPTRALPPSKEGLPIAAPAAPLLQRDPRSPAAGSARIDPQIYWTGPEMLLDAHAELMNRHREWMNRHGAGIDRPPEVYPKLGRSCL